MPEKTGLDTNKTKIAVHIAHIHSCGHPYEEVLHIESADFSIKQEIPPMFPNEETSGYKPFVIPETPKPTITFTGTHNKLEINGLDFKEHRITCQGCGADMLLPDKEP